MFIEVWPEELLGQRSQLISIPPALTHSSVAEWYQYANGKHQCIAFNCFRLSLDIRADAGIFVMVNEISVYAINRSLSQLLIVCVVHSILLNVMQA